jgi:predicted phage terminase large subunit-like protein
MAMLTAAEQDHLLEEFGSESVHALLYEWSFWGRPSQLAPNADWSTWLILAGRGFGKTRAGAEWVRSLAESSGDIRIALVAANAADGRGVMVEGESGLIAIAPPAMRPRYEPSRRRLVWPNGAQAFVYSAEEPEQLRGPQHHAAWCDELAKWAHVEATWMNLQMGLRLGEKPRVVVTTTPRPLPLLKSLLRNERTAITRGKTSDNSANLPVAYMQAVTEAYAGSRLGRQELEGEIIEDVEGALWNRDALEAVRVLEAPTLSRVVVAVDPPAGAGASSDACGIVVVGRGEDGQAYVLADRSVQGLSPEGWARAVVDAADAFQAERVVAEVNNGGAMVESVLRAVDAVLPMKAVRASRGKVARAEPVASLYEAGKVHHVGAFPRLEDEMCGLLAGGAYVGPGRSPDRADALVWALTELMLGTNLRPLVRVV